MLFSQKYRLYNFTFSTNGAAEITENNETSVNGSTYTKRLLGVLNNVKASREPNTYEVNHTEIKLLNGFDPVYFTEQFSLTPKLQMLREFCDPSLVSEFDACMSKARWLVILRKSIDETPDNMTVRYLLGFKF